MSKMKLLAAAAALMLMAGRTWAAVGIAKVAGTADDSEITGTLHFEDTKEGLHISGQIDNAPVGEHGFHIHEFGDCGDEGKNAGSHFNPDGHQHGSVTKDGVAKAHAGDFGNIKIAENGTGKVDITIPKLTLTGGKYAVAGHALILHEKNDDFGQPTGNAGGRIACGAIVLSGK